MIFWYTGQPGHGKTLHGLQHAIEMKADADKKHKADPAKYPNRELLICNVRGMDFSKVDGTPLEADEFKVWADSPEYIEQLKLIESDSSLTERQRAEKVEALGKLKIATEMINPRFHNAIILVDEAYEHGIFPKRSPGAKLPRHVERMAKHRHYGIDFIGICQSPDTQCDSFLRDLIERHIHVRRRFGTKFVHLREFDKFCSTPEKSHALTVRRVVLPKKMFGLYESTKLDTTERRIPWYYIVFPLLALALGIATWYWFGWLKRYGMDGSGTAGKTVAAGKVADGAPATAANAAAVSKPKTPSEYLAQYMPRLPSQPWSAPAYDGMHVAPTPPRVFCMAVGAGTDANGKYGEEKCSCLTEQGTHYEMDLNQCKIVATAGQYEPLRDAKMSRAESMDDSAKRERFAADRDRYHADFESRVGAAERGSSGGEVVPGAVIGGDVRTIGNGNVAPSSLPSIGR